MSVLVKGMEKPEHCGYCRFRYDGICHALQKTQYSMNECPLVVIDDAGLNDTISRQTAVDEFYQYPNINWTTLDVMEKIDKVPSIDAVPVIRCKDCKYYKENTIICNRYGLEDDDYCSWAERREE